jgi:hypothetical protein
VGLAVPASPIARAPAGLRKSPVMKYSEGPSGPAAAGRELRPSGRRKRLLLAPSFIKARVHLDVVIPAPPREAGQAPSPPPRSRQGRRRAPTAAIGPGRGQVLLARSVRTPDVAERGELACSGSEPGAHRTQGAAPPHRRNAGGKPRRGRPPPGRRRVVSFGTGARCTGISRRSSGESLQPSEARVQRLAVNRRLCRFFSPTPRSAPSGQPGGAGPAPRAVGRRPSATGRPPRPRAATRN